MLGRIFARKKPAPEGKTKPGPTPLEETLQRIAETMHEANKRCDQVLERLQRKDGGKAA
jgi:hypothetical protein